jgi:hypothetical protein
MRPAISARFTAVGRLVTRKSSLDATNAAAASPVCNPGAAAESSTATASAAVMAMAGAPLTTMSRMQACAASALATGK